MIRSFFMLCSGADMDILETCSSGEKNKYAGIGATVFFTALMAFIAASYALYTVFDNVYAAIAFGLVWGMLIFNLDRFIVSTIKKRNSVKSEILQATPRIILAVIIAVVISKPLELKIFEKEIDRVLLEQKNDFTLANKQQIAQQYNPLIEQLNGEIETLKTDIDLKEAETNDLYETYIAEAEGRKGTLLVGKGPVYSEKREKHDAYLTELVELKETNKQKILDIENQIAGLNAEYALEVENSQPIIDGFDGLMARISALGELPWFPSFFIFLLFLAIETSPIAVKLLAPKGSYDLKLEEEESIVATWVDQKVGQRAEILSTDTILNERIYSEIAEEEAVYAYKKQKAEELLRLQADSFHELQVKNL
ncbi:MAG: DUF4407 domain-containing protein [Flavobacteriaceae bacterium]